MDIVSFKEAFMGDMNTTVFISFLVWGYIGVIVNMVIEVFKRKPLSKHSPKEFKADYYISDNKKRIVAAIILLPVSILLCKEMIGIDITNGIAFALGYGSDTLAELFKRKTSKYVGVGDGQEESK
jgi:hypothetical protein